MDDDGDGVIGWIREAAGVKRGLCGVAGIMPCACSGYGGAMEPEVVFERVAPVIPVRDFDAAVERYRRLGFDVELYTGPTQYAFVERGPLSMHLHGWRGWDRSGGIVYLYVSDADALHAQWTRAGVDGRFGDPHDTDYGLREFEYTDPEGTVHRVGSPLVSPGAP